MMKPYVKTLTIVVGTLLGAYLGYNAASLLVRQAEERGQKMPINTQQGLKLGMGLWHLFRDFDKIVK
jgi:hypothetical protein